MTIVKTNLKETEKVKIYELTHSSTSRRISECEGETFTAVNYVLTDENVLTVESSDGEIYGTNSAVFIREFCDIAEFLGLENRMIKITSGRSKAGRIFYSCRVVSEENPSGADIHGTSVAFTDDTDSKV